MAFDVGELWSLDLFELEKKHFLIGVDKVSQYIMLKQVANQKTSTITRILQEWTLMFGLPSMIKSDGGPCFKSGPFKEFADKYKISHMITSAYHAPSNGQVERAIQEVKKMLEKNRNFCPMEVAFTLNYTDRNPNLGAPMTIFMGRPTRSMEPNSKNKVCNIVADIEARRQKALKEGLEKNKRYNRDVFQEGEEVLIQDNKTRKWTTKGKIIKPRKNLGGTGPRSYVIKANDGSEYLRNATYIARMPPVVAQLEEMWQSQSN